MNDLTKKIVRHKKRRTRHQKALLRTDLTLEEKTRHWKGMQIQTSIINHLKEVRESNDQGKC